MSSKSIKVLLADDDADDRLFFEQAIAQVSQPTTLTILNDGEELMEFLSDEKNEIPSVLFLDINMPRKNGFECLTSIKLNDRLRRMPVVVFSTSNSWDHINTVFKTGANIYIHKPGDFSELKQIIEHALPVAIKNEFSTSQLKYILNANNLKHLNILLADDDTDDCHFFKEAVKEMKLSTKITTVHDGEQLMQLLENANEELPHVLFCDLNMPRKNGFECLSEIKLHKNLGQLPVIMFSTSFELDVVNKLYQNGAQYFIRKPSEFSQFKKIIQQTLTQMTADIANDNPGKLLQPNREYFVRTIQ